MSKSLTETVPIHQEIKDRSGPDAVQDLSETQWRILILSSAVAVTLFSIYCLSHGITIIFMHLYYFPLILLAYRYGWRGFGMASLLASSYLFLVVLYHPEQAEVTGALFRVTVFISISAVVAYLSERLVTARQSEKKSTDEILQLQQFQESVITNANIWITVLAPDGTILIWNDAAEAISGYKKVDVTGKRSVWGWMYPDREYRKKITADIQRIIERDTYLENFETEIRCADGSEKTIVWNTRGLRDTSGNMNGYIAIGRDVTHLNLAENQARMSTEIYHEFFTTSQDCVFITSPEGKWIDFNEGAVALFGYETREELLKIPIMELYKTSSDRVAFLDRIRRYGFVKEYPVQLRRRNGTIIDSLITTAPLHNDDGSLRAYIGTIRDITERKKFEESLRTSEEKFRTIFNSLNDGIHLHEIEPDGSPGKFIDVNDVACRMLQYTREEMIRMSPLDFATPFHNPPVEEVIHDLRTKGHAFFETGHIRRDGTVVPVEINAHVVSFSGARFVVSAIRDITKRRLAELALRESEEKYRTYIENAIEGVFVVDSTSRYIDVNRAACHLVGYTREELLQKTIMDLVWEESQDKRLREFEALKNSGLITTELNLKRKDGTLIPIILNAVTLPGGNVMSFCVDITQRKRMEEELRESHQLLQTVLDTIPIGVFWKNRNSQYLGCNRIAAHDAGFSQPEEVTGKTDFELGWRSLAESYRADDKLVMNTGIPKIGYEESVIQPDGRVQWVRTNKIPLLDMNGLAYGVVGTYEDITSRKEAEKNLAFTNTILRTQQETSIDGILVVNTNGSIVSFNQRFIEIWGIPEDIIASRSDEQALGYVLQSLSDPEEFLAKVKYLYDHIEEKSSDELLMKDGRILERYSAPTIDSDGTWYGRVWYFRDITRRKKAEEELRRINDHLDSLVKERTQALEAEIDQRRIVEEQIKGSLAEKIVLLREVHHRVKNNLQIMISLLSLQSRMVSDPQVIAALRESTQRLRAMAMVHEKLYGGTDLSHIELRSYLASLVNSQIAFHQLRPERIVVEIVSEDTMMDINTAIPLGLIINELISNAIQHGFPEERKGTIRIRTRIDGDQLDITVSDNGIGMPSEIDWKNTPSLGLRLVSSLIRQLKGTVELDRTEGTKFHLSIPVVGSQSPEENQGIGS